MTEVNVYKAFVSPDGTVHRVDFSGAGLAGWQGMNGVGNALEGDHPHIVDVRAVAVIGPTGTVFLLEPVHVDRKIHEGVCACHHAPL